MFKLGNVKKPVEQTNDGLNTSVQVQTVLRDPLPHQIDALKFCEKRNHPALFMQMRLGKTLVLIRWAVPRIARTNSSALVIAPLDVLRSWRKELTLEGQPFVDLAALPSRDKRRAHLINRKAGTWYLANYELVRSLPEIVWMKWGLVACDESTRIKNPAAKITKLVCDGFRYVHHRAILSGLPAPEGPLELYSQFKFLHGSFLQCKNYYSFRSTYFDPPLDQFDYQGWAPKKGVPIILERALQEKAFRLTRTQAGLGDWKSHEVSTVPLSTALRKHYRQVEKEFAFEGTETQWAMVAELWLGRLAGGFSPTPPHELLSPDKINATVRLFTEGELKHEQAVIWCRFNREIAELEKQFSNASSRFKPAIVTGESSTSQRSEAMDSFERGTSQILIAQGACARYGLDFSAASVAIYFSNHYSCEIREQSEDRIVHPTKKTPLLIMDMMTENTVDEEIIDTLQMKGANARMLMNNLRTGIERRRESYR